MPQIDRFGAFARSGRLIALVFAACACRRSGEPGGAAGAVPAAGDRVAALPQFDAAVAAARSGEDGAALAALDRALALDPAFVQARVMRAALHARPGLCLDPAAAADDLATARSLGADPASLVGFEGLVRFQLGDVAAAKPLLAQAWAAPEAATEATTRADVALALGQIALREARFDEARTCFEAARRLLPAHPVPCEALAQLAVELGDAAEQERWLAEAVVHDPRSLAARNARAKLYARSGRAEQARLERAIHETLRRLSDDESRNFAIDHAQRADLWERYVVLVPGDAAARLEVVRERTRAGDVAAARAAAVRYAAMPGSPPQTWETVIRDLERMQAGPPAQKKGGS